ncbi:hypothetical protein Q4Q49_21795 [Shewanella sp. SP1S1-7]|uniref:hypothetical protein n=1 Tax=Shewanella sp. SP1S1-7 TaxID=3063536 RepID=UPI00288F0652|nr:hypothetical protein [Shewanella sp. SP1S1-7]MDT3337904.1 hypothetical protein [Shewanella sp. SP1S1-7]
MLPLWTQRRNSSFAALILLCGLVGVAPSEAALTKPDVEIDPILPSIPLPVAIPSLSGSRFSSRVELRWSIDCSVTAVNIQESINNQSWASIYTGLGQADNTAAYATFAVGGDICSGDWSSKRLLQLPNKTLPGYYYRINACIGTACSAYSASTLVGTAPAGGTPSQSSILASIATIPDASNSLASPAFDELVGEIQGQATVDGGAFSYTVPLTVAPGRNGVQPSLSLNS